MQSSFGSIEAISVKKSITREVDAEGNTLPPTLEYKISPLQTWESNILPVLAMLGGISPINEAALKAETDPNPKFLNVFDRFADSVVGEYKEIFISERNILGEEFLIALPDEEIESSSEAFKDWELNC